MHHDSIPLRAPRALILSIHQPTLHPPVGEPRLARPRYAAGAPHSRDVSDPSDLQRFAIDRTDPTDGIAVSDVTGADAAIDLCSSVWEGDRRQDSAAVDVRQGQGQARSKPGSGQHLPPAEIYLDPAVSASSTLRVLDAICRVQEPSAQDGSRLKAIRGRLLDPIGSQGAHLDGRGRVERAPHRFVSAGL